MEKIPTIFNRGPDFKVMDEIREGCEWVFAGEGKATEKLDGTNVRLTVRAGTVLTGTVVRVEKRRNPSKVQKAQGISTPWYVDADEAAKEDKWIFEAVSNTDTSNFPEGEHSCEALGPRIQGNPLGLENHLCVPFNLAIPVFEDIPLTFDAMQEFITGLESKFSPNNPVEGIVFHHSDGRRAKIKIKDFAK